MLDAKSSVPYNNVVTLLEDGCNSSTRVSPGTLGRLATINISSKIKTNIDVFDLSCFLRSKFSESIGVFYKAEDLQ